MLLREAVLETFLESFTTSGETGTHSPLLGPRGRHPVSLCPGALPLRQSALPPPQELDACQTCPEWAGASVWVRWGFARRGPARKGHICEKTTISGGFLF